MNNELKKCLSDDTIFNKINVKYISLKEEDIRRNNAHLYQVIPILIERMKTIDTLFAKTYQKIEFCGSFYKGTKIDKPNEFDLNVIIKLPIDYNHIKFALDYPGYVSIDISACPYVQLLDGKETKAFRLLVTNGFVNQEYFRRWIEGIISKALIGLPIVNKMYTLKYSPTVTYGISIRKSGPAFTVIVRTPDYDIIEVDLVPALGFTCPILEKFYIARENQNDMWFAIPKPSVEIFHNKDIYWRCSFYHQEKYILRKYGRMKPVIRQLKKMRDLQQWKCLASYFIEILFLNNLDELKENSLNTVPFTLLFYQMLKKLHIVCKSHYLEFYWDKSNNMLHKINKDEMNNIAQRLQRIIMNIEKNIATDKMIIARYILTPKELEMLQSDNSFEILPDIEQQTSNNEEPSRCIML